MVQSQMIQHLWPILSINVGRRTYISPDEFYECLLYIQEKAREVLPHELSYL